MPFKNDTAAAVFNIIASHFVLFEWQVAHVDVVYSNKEARND